MKSISKLYTAIAFDFAEATTDAVTTKKKSWSGKKYQDRVTQRVKEFLIAELEDVLRNGHGGGNFRRLLIMKIGELEDYGKETITTG